MSSKVLWIITLFAAAAVPVTSEAQVFTLSRGRMQATSASKTMYLSRMREIRALTTMRSRMRGIPALTAMPSPSRTLGTSRTVRSLSHNSRT